MCWSLVELIKQRLLGLVMEHQRECGSERGRSEEKPAATVCARLRVGIRYMLDLFLSCRCLPKAGTPEDSELLPDPLL